MKYLIVSVLVLSATLAQAQNFPPQSRTNPFPGYRNASLSSGGTGNYMLDAMQTAREAREQQEQLDRMEEKLDALTAQSHWSQTDTFRQGMEHLDQYIREKCLKGLSPQAC